jgi:death-on-curing protein
MAFIYLTIDHVLELHRMVMELGGLDGVRSTHSLAAAVMQPQQSAFGEDAYPTLGETAAAYAFFIVQNHPFIDGNKRTGEMAMVTFLDLNGYELDDDEDAIAQMLEDIASGVVDQSEFFGWVVNHTRLKREEKVVGLPPRS